MPIEKKHDLNSVVIPEVLDMEVETDNESEPEKRDYDELLNALMLIKFKIKMINDLRKVGMVTRKEYYGMKKSYKSLYTRQLKLFCESNELKGDIDISECDIKLQELQNDYKQIKKHGKSLFKLIKLD